MATPEAEAPSLERSTVYVIATPLGSLGELSPRVSQCLREVDHLFAEDTRRTGQLLSHLGISRKLESLHAHNEIKKRHALLELLAQGDNIGIVSDAGTPGISDPGADLVHAAHEAGYAVSPIAGPSALSAALSVSGFPQAAPDVWFVGFLPTKGAARKRLLQRISQWEGVVVLFEGPHRATSTLKDLADDNPQRLACACRELTKLHEEVHRAPLAQLVGWAEQGMRGELTVVIGPQEIAEAPPKSVTDIDEALQRCMTAGLSTRDAATAVAAVFGLPRREVYGRAHALDTSDPS